MKATGPETGSGPGPRTGSAARPRPGEFDESYKLEVLEPARKAGDQPPEDLRVRYQLREPLVAAEVAAQVKLVRQCWRRSRGQLKYRKLVDRLEAEHRELATLFAAAEGGDLRPLATRLRGGEELAARRRAEAKSRLLDAAGAVRLLAPADVEGIARSTGMDRGELVSLAKVDGIAIREPDPLPSGPPYQGYARARESLGVLGRRHLVEFVFDGPPAGPMRVLDGFAAPGVRLDPAAVATVSAQWARRPRDTSSTNADTVLVMLKQCDRLDDLVLYDIVDRLRERHRQRASQPALLRHAVEDLGIEAGDARRLVFAVVREGGPTGGLAGRLRQLLDSGQVHAAAVLAETETDGAITGATGTAGTAGAAAPDSGSDPAHPGSGGTGSGGTGSGGTGTGGTGTGGAGTGGTGTGGADVDEDVLLAATEARRRVTRALELRALAIAALDTRAATSGAEAGPRFPPDGPVRGAPDDNAGGVPGPDPDLAWRLLADALRLVPDLPGAEDAQRRIPPAPVTEPRAVAEYRHDDAVVRLGWSASASKAGEIGYQVIRRTGRPPQDPADGEPIAEIGPSASGTGAVDEHPPVNVPLYYAVVARRGDAAARPAVTGPVLVRPEPYGVELHASDGLVTGRWRCPAEAARVLVTREQSAPTGPGTTGPVSVAADRAGLRDAVRNGVTYHYRVCAVYLGPDGREILTPGVRRSVTASAPPDPVARLALAPDPRDPGRLDIVFDPPAHGTVELFMLGDPPPWPYGTAVTLAELRRAGRRLPATTTPRGLAVRPELSGVLLAVTVAGDGAVIGAHERHVNLPPPQGLVAERRGATLHLGFDWPPDVAEVELSHWAGDGEPRRMVVTRAGYDADGGIRLAAPESEPITVSVAATGTGGGRRVTGIPVTTSVPPRAVVRYDLDRSGPPWRRRLVVRLTPEPAPAAGPGRADDGSAAGNTAAATTRAAAGSTAVAGPSAPVIGRLLLVLRPGRVMPRRPEDGETIAQWPDVELSGPVELSVPLPERSGPYWLRCFVDDEAGDSTTPGPATPGTAPREHATGRGAVRVELADPPVRRLQVKG